MDRSVIVSRAATLAELHATHHPLVLPTVWDAWSAQTAADAGFGALTIGSRPLATSRGARDNEGQSFAEVITAARSITASVNVPVSIDLEAGYGLDPAELIEGLLDAGGAGLNIEDTVHSQGGRIRSTEEHAAYVAGLRAAADAAGFAIWINGRTDLFLHADNVASVADEAIARMQALVAAGADSVYPLGIQDNDELITAVVRSVSVPVNCTAHPVNHDLQRFARLGVGRITYGPLFQAALTGTAKTMLTSWLA